MLWGIVLPLVSNKLKRVKEVRQTCGLLQMTPTEKRYKSLLAGLLVGFILVEIPFVRAWLNEQGGVWGINAHFFHQLLHDPLYQVTAIDFTVLALLVYCWMVWDSRRRQHPKRAWYWLPVFLISPALGTLGYLLTRRGWEFPPERA